MSLTSSSASIIKPPYRDLPIPPPLNRQESDRNSESSHESSEITILPINSHSSSSFALNPEAPEDTAFAPPAAVQKSSNRGQSATPVWMRVDEVTSSSPPAAVQKSSNRDRK